MYWTHTGSAMMMVDSIYSARLLFLKRATSELLDLAERVDERGARRHKYRPHATTRTEERGSQAMIALVKQEGARNDHGVWCPAGHILHVSSV